MSVTNSAQSRPRVPKVHVLTVEFIDKVKMGAIASGRLQLGVRFQTLSSINQHHRVICRQSAIGIFTSPGDRGPNKSDSSGKNTVEVIEIPCCCSIAIQSEVALAAPAVPLLRPAVLQSKSFSVSVVLPASG